jgi:hypothetical protein
VSVSASALFWRNRHMRCLCLVLLMLSLTELPVAAAGQAVSPPPGDQEQRVQRQQPARGGQQRMEAPRGTGMIRGAVVAADTGAPVRRAQVRVSAPQAGTRVTVTDAQGRFEIRELAPGRYTVTASKAGFVSVQYGQRRPAEPGTPLDLADAQAIDKLVIGLPRGSVISGRVTDEFGEPAANVVINALRFGYGAGTRRLMLASSQNARDTTDDQGQFRLFGLPPGEYFVSATLRAAPDVESPTEEPSGYAPTYYPGTPSLGDAQRIRVDVGQEQSGIAFALFATRLVQVTGAVVDSRGLAASGGAVMLSPASASGVPVAQVTAGSVDEAGQFRLRNVPPGRYVLTANTSGGFGNPMRRGAGAERRATTEVGTHDLVVGTEDLHGILVGTLPGARVSGQVITDTGLAPPYRPRQMTVTSHAVPVIAAGAGAGAGAAPARLNDDWTYQFENLFGSRVFTANLPEGWYLKQVLLSGQDITDTPVGMPPGQTITGVQVVITERTTELSGRVTDIRGAAVTDATLVILPDDEDKWTAPSRFIRTARPDQDGRFEIRGLPPYDRYLAVTVQALEEGQASDPEFLQSVRTRASSFALNEGELRVLDLRIHDR